MNLKIITIVSVLGFNIHSNGQSTIAECPFLKTAGFNVFIPGYSDTTQANGLKARTIEAATLVNGFELLSDDSLAKVKSFHLVFDDEDGTLYSKSANNSKMSDDQSHIVPLSKMKTATLITLDQIKVEYNGRCYMIAAQVYYAK